MSNASIPDALAALPAWRLREIPARPGADPSTAGREIFRRYKFASFRDAIGFMQSAVDTIDAMDHHPTWHNVFNLVTVRLSTHDAGNQPTDKDMQLASALDTLAEAFPKG